MPYPFNAVDQATDVVQGWKTFDAAFQVGDLTCAALEGEVNEALNLQNQIDALKKQLTELRNQRDAKAASIWEKVKRVRNTVKGLFGDNSSQYELVGGTRLSERKKSVKKAPAA